MSQCEPTNFSRPSAETRSEAGWTAFAQAETLWKEGLTERAIETLCHAHALAPEDNALRTECARALAGLGALEEAFAAWEDVLASCPESREARFGRGYVLFLMDRLEEAQSAVAELVATEAADAEAAWLYAGILLRLQGERHPLVLDAYERAVALAPENGYLQVEYGDVLRACGRYAEAGALYAAVSAQGADEEEPLYLEATFKLGTVRLTLGETALARTAFDAVLAISPDYPDAQAMRDFTEYGN